MIGYDVGSGDNRFCLVSMCDDMITVKGSTAEALAVHLNEMKARPQTIHVEDTGRDKLGRPIRK